MKKDLLIEGMTCGHCAGRVEKALREVAGVKNVKVDLGKNSAEVHGEVDDKSLSEAVIEAGYAVTSIKLA